MDAENTSKPEKEDKVKAKNPKVLHSELGNQIKSASSKEKTSTIKTDPSLDNLKTVPESCESGTKNGTNPTIKVGEAINILLLGETGVGKSTFINAYYNYLTFGSLEEAIKEPKLHGLICSTFSFTDSQYNTKAFTVSQNVGTSSKVNLMDDGIDCETNEAFEPGQSSTQHAKAYEFRHQGRLIRLIDTPGIGDSRGIRVDQANFKQTIEYLQRMDHLNAVCILLKPNVKRMTLQTRYCIKELFSHLNKVSIQNLVFCFTNTRGTNFRPGDALPTLREYIKKEIDEVSQITVPLGRNNIVCMDNEAFRYLVLAKNVKSDEERACFSEFGEQKTFAESWEKSMEASEKLVKYAQTLPVLKMSEMVVYNQTRSMSLDLVQKIIDVLVRIAQGDLQANEDEIDHLRNEIIKSVAAVTAHLSSKAVTVFNDQFDAYLEEKINALKQSTIERDWKILPVFEEWRVEYRNKLTELLSAGTASSIDVKAGVSQLECMLNLVVTYSKHQLGQVMPKMPQPIDTSFDTNQKETKNCLNKGQTFTAKLSSSSLESSNQHGQISSSSSTVERSQLNVILFGQKGVGKSSLINLFANLLAFDSFEAASNGKFKSPIPVFDSADATGGGSDVSASHTPETKAYLLNGHVDGKQICLNVIDTPGICEESGLEQNRKNLDRTIEYIKQFESLNAICFVLKPKDILSEKMSLRLRYCLNELLIRLDRASAPNICFCYTHARGTSFRPDNSYELIKKEMEKICNKCDIQIPVESANTFCFDSEAFRYLAVKEKANQFKNSSLEIFRNSWELSTDALKKMIIHATNLRPISVKSIFMLNQARKALMRLTKPANEILQIKTKKQLEQHKKKQLEDINTRKVSLEDRLYTHKTIQIITVKIVCTFCPQVTNVSQHHKQKTNLVCFEESFDGVETLTVEQSRIKNSPAFKHGESNECINCRHHFTLHTSNKEVRKTSLKVEDPEVKKELNEIERRLQILEGSISCTQINDLKMKQEWLIKSSAKIAKYIKHKSIFANNSEHEKLLELLIREEEHKELYGTKWQTVSESKKALREEKRNYDAEVKFLTDSLNASENVEIASDAEIEQLIDELKCTTIN